jgi:outer membrane protein TolC
MLTSFILLPILFAFGPAVACAADATSAGAPTTSATEAAPPLGELVAQALADNPELTASEERWLMTMEKARQAGSWDDPMLMLGINNGLIRTPLDFEREEMTSKVIGISQMVPYFGKRSLAREAASKDTLSARAQHEERKLELAAMVKETYARLFFVDRALEVVERNLRIMEDIILFTEVRYGVGQGMQQDVLRAQLERSRMLDMQIGLRQQRRTLEATINRLLFRPADTPIGSIADLAIPPIATPAAELEKIALQNRPAFAGLAAQVEKGRAEERLAKREFYPDFTLSLEYMQREEAMESEGLDMYSANVSFNLPVRLERRRAMVAEAQASTRMAQAEREMLGNDIRSGIADLLAQLEKSRSLIALYREGIIPQATRSFESAQIAYQNNQTDFLMMLESLQRLFNTERDYYEMVSDYRMNLARLEALVGSELASN